VIPECSQRLRFHDIFGINSDNYNDLIIPLLKGQIKEGFEEGQQVK
jgi:hypothetical protein